MLGWQISTGITGSFQSESLATLDWNRWQVSTGISGNLRPEYAGCFGCCSSCRKPSSASSGCGRWCLASRPPHPKRRSPRSWRCWERRIGDEVQSPSRRQRRPAPRHHAQRRRANKTMVVRRGAVVGSAPLDSQPRGHDRAAARSYPTPESCTSRGGHHHGDRSGAQGDTARARGRIMALGCSWAPPGGRLVHAGRV